MSTVLVGCVTYDPRIVTIWEGFLPYFAKHGVRTDYMLYSNYERLVDALLSGAVNIATESTGWDGIRALARDGHRTRCVCAFPSLVRPGLPHPPRAGGPEHFAHLPVLLGHVR